MINIIFETSDKTGRKIYLTKERYAHILSHSEMQDKIEEIIGTLKYPLKITDYSLEKDVKYYYKYIKSEKMYLRVIVKYLNGKGFIITTYLIDKIR